MLFLHKNITNEALASFSNAAISGSERQQIAEGSSDADLTDGGLPLTGAPYEARFHFDDDFTYDDVARDISIPSDLKLVGTRHIGF